MSIDSTMNYELPVDEFVISVNMPQRIHERSMIISTTDRLISPLDVVLSPEIVQGVANLATCTRYPVRFQPAERHL